MNPRRTTDLLSRVLGAAMRITAWTIAADEDAAAGAMPPDCFDKGLPATNVEFSPYENMVYRKVVFAVPEQKDGSQLTVGLLPLPEDKPDEKTTHRETKTKSGKHYPNGNDFLAWVINPIVVNSEGTPQTKFNPPIRMVVTIEDEDLKATSCTDHEGKFAIVAAYPKHGEWNYKILDTTRDGNTLTACLSNLDPNDPLALGHP